jgi:hypothetical protein
MARSGTKTDAVLAASLAAGATHEQAAAAAGVSLRTVGRRMADPDFRKLVDREQDSILERFTGGAAAKLGETLERLGELIHSTKELVALGACRTLAELLLRVREATTVGRRLRELENASHDRDSPPEEPGEDRDGGGGAPDPGGDQEGPGGGPDDGEGDPG